MFFCYYVLIFIPASRILANLFILYIEYSLLVISGHLTVPSFLPLPDMS